MGVHQLYLSSANTHIFIQLDKSIGGTPDGYIYLEITYDGKTTYIRYVLPEQIRAINLLENLENVKFVNLAFKINEQEREEIEINDIARLVIEPNKYSTDVLLHLKGQTINVTNRKDGKVTNSYSYEKDLTYLLASYLKDIDNTHIRLSQSLEYELERALFNKYKGDGDDYCPNLRYLDWKRNFHYNEFSTSIRYEE